MGRIPFILTACEDGYDQSAHSCRFMAETEAAGNFGTADAGDRGGRKLWNSRCPRPINTGQTLLQILTTDIKSATILHILVSVRQLVVVLTLFRHYAIILKSPDGRNARQRTGRSIGKPMDISS